MGLVITIPTRFPRNKIPLLLTEHEHWINQQLVKHKHSLQVIDLPQKLTLSFLDKQYDLEYYPEKIRVHEVGNLLKVPHDSHQKAVKHLRHWIRGQAKKVLTPYLESVAKEFGFGFDRTIIRSQKSRWGSCSSSGTISLNDQLLFIPRDTVRYLMIHELCHTRYMNHSREYWQLVSDCCPDHAIHEKVLNRGHDHVPGWFLQSLHH